MARHPHPPRTARQTPTELMDLNHETGGAIDGWAHVEQSLATILTTGFSTRVFRREFGSGLPDLVDAPLNEANILSIYMSVADAVGDWEPRFEMTDIAVSRLEAGMIAVTLTGNYRPKAHLGDLSTAEDGTRTVRVVRDRAEHWSVAT